MSSFLNKVFGRKKEGETSPGWRSASGDLLDGKFEDVSPTVSPAATHFPDLQENGSHRGRGNDRTFTESKLRTFFRSKSRSRAASPIRSHRKLEELPHLPLSLLAHLNQDEVEVLLSDKVIGERRLTPVEAVGLVKVCAQAINDHGVDTLGLMNPNWYSASPEVQRRLISLFIQSLTAPSPLSTLPSFDSEINSTKSPHDIAAVLRWALRHLQLQGDAFGHQEEWYHAFFDAERKAEYPPKSFSNILAPLIPSEHLNLLKEVLDLLSSLSPHGEANSTSGSKLSKIFGLWLLNAHRVETNDDWKSFYARWDLAGRQLEHIFFTRIRDEAVEKRLPTRLVDLVRKYPFYRDNASPTTDLRLLPRSKLSTPIYDALLVRVETEVPTDSLRPKSRIHPVRVLAEALSSKAEEGELSSLWTKITEVSKGEGSGTPLSRILSDDTIRLLSLLPEDDGFNDEKSPTYSLLPLSPASPKFKRNSFSLSEFTEEMKRTHSTQSTASALSPISSPISTDWSLFSSTGFGASPTLTPLSSALFSPDIERTSPPSRKHSRHGKEPSTASTILRKSVDFAPIAPTGTITEEQGVNFPSNISLLQVVQLDEAFVDFYYDALLDPISSTWPSFVVCKLKQSVVPELKYGPIEEGRPQKTLQWLVLEQHHTVKAPPAPTPEEPVEASTERPSSPQSISKRRFSFWSASRSNSTTSIGSTKSKKKDLLRSQRASEMGEVVEEGESAGAGTERRGSNTRSRWRTKAEDVVKVRIPSPKPRKSGDVRSLKSVDVGPAPVVKKPVPALIEEKKEGGGEVSGEAVAAAAGVVGVGVAGAALAAAAQTDKEEATPAEPQLVEGDTKVKEVKGAEGTTPAPEEGVVLPVEVKEGSVAVEEKPVVEGAIGPTAEGVPNVVTHVAEPTVEDSIVEVQEGPVTQKIEEEKAKEEERVEVEKPVEIVAAVGGEAGQVEPSPAPEPVLEWGIPVEGAPAPMVEDDAALEGIPAAVGEEVVAQKAAPVVSEAQVEEVAGTSQAPQAVEESIPIVIEEDEIAAQEPEPSAVEHRAEATEVPAAPAPLAEEKPKPEENALESGHAVEPPVVFEEKDEVPVTNGHLTEALSPEVPLVEESAPERPFAAIEPAPPAEATTERRVVIEEEDVPGPEPEVPQTQEEDIALVPEAAVPEVGEEPAPIDTIVGSGSLKEELTAAEPEDKPINKEEDATTPSDTVIPSQSIHDLPTDVPEIPALSADETKPEATDTLVELHPNAEYGAAELENDAQDTTANPVNNGAEKEAEEREPIQNRTLTTQESELEPAALADSIRTEGAEATPDEADQLTVASRAQDEEGPRSVNVISSVPHLEPLKIGDDDEFSKEGDLPAVPLVDVDIREPLDSSDHVIVPLSQVEAQYDAQPSSPSLSETLEAQHLPSVIEHALEAGLTPSAEALLDAVQSSEGATEDDAVTRTTPPAIDVALAERLAEADDLPTAIEAAFESGFAHNPEALLNAVQATLTATVFAPGEPSPSVEKKEDEGGLNRAASILQLNGNGLHQEDALEIETKEQSAAHDNSGADEKELTLAADDTPADDTARKPIPASAEVVVPPLTEEKESVLEPSDDLEPAEVVTEVSVQEPAPEEDGGPVLGASAEDAPAVAVEDPEPTVRATPQDIPVVESEAAPIVEEATRPDEVAQFIDGEPQEEEIVAVQDQAPVVEDDSRGVTELNPPLEEVIPAELKEPALVGVQDDVVAVDHETALGSEQVVESQTPVQEPETQVVEEEPPALVTKDGTPVVSGEAAELETETVVLEENALIVENAEPTERISEVENEPPVTGEESHVIDEESTAREEPELETPVVEEEPATTEEAPLVEEENHVVENTPVVEQEATELEDVPPVVEKDASISGDVPVEEQETLRKRLPPAEEEPAVDATPVVKEVLEEAKPVVEQPVAEGDQEKPATDDKTPDFKEEAPPVDEEPVAQEENPIAEDEVAIIEEAPVAEEKAVVEESEGQEPPFEEKAPVVEEKLEEEPILEEETAVEGVPTEEEKVVVEEETPGVVEEVTPVEGELVEETPVVEKQEPIAQNVAAIEEQPIVVEETPAVEESTPVIEGVPVVDQEPPTDDDATPGPEPTLPTEEESPVVKETVLDEEASPIVEEEVAEKRTPIEEEEISVEKDEGSSTVEEAPPVGEYKAVEGAQASNAEVPEDVEEPVVQDEAPIAEDMKVVEEDQVVEGEGFAEEKVAEEETAEEAKTVVENAVVEDSSVEEPASEGQAPIVEEEPFVEDQVAGEEGLEEAPEVEEDKVVLGKEVAGQGSPIVEEEPPAPEEGRPTIEEERVVVEEEERVVEEEVPVVQQEEAIRREATPVLEGGAPASEPTFVVEEPIVEQDPPAIEGDISDVQVLTPAVDENITIDEEILAVDENLSVKEAPVIEEAAGEKHEGDEVDPDVEDGIPVEEPKPIEDSQPVVADTPSDERVIVVEEEVPVVVDSPPLVEETPVVEEEPIVEDSKSVVEEVPAGDPKLVSEEEASAGEDNAPEVSQSEPPITAEEELIPQGQDETPVITETTPAEDPTPAVDEATPAVEDSPPIVEDAPLVAPVIEEPEPVVAENEDPTATEPIPLDDTPAAAEDPAQPAVEDAPALEDTPAPVEDAHPVVEDSPATEHNPAVDEERPAIVEDNTHLFEEPEPPVVRQSELVIEEEIPTVVEPAPVEDVKPAVDEETSAVVEDEQSAVREEVAVEADAHVLEAPDVHEEAPEINGVARVPTSEEKEPTPLIEDAPVPTEGVPLTADSDIPSSPPQDAPQAELSNTDKQFEVEDPTDQVETPSAPTTDAQDSTAAAIIDKLSTPLVEDDDDPIEVNEPKPSAIVVEEATTTPNV
ncbi:hypothetical protein FA13DRAFT_1800496 [Coprinellus micaceus]|uniref:Rho-GAP domain-containing protein n=1 Tax=Coprinellus micaceus TaxID=71717 RepID=A0A4Y7SGZ0_COPMI|nr:hypothetical protein FA13DRAFT_1800496 [Coprinellus micaceus]